MKPIEVSKEPSPVAALALAPVQRRGPLARWRSQLVSLVGLPWQRRLARAYLFVDAIRHWERECSRLSEEELRQRGLHLRGRSRGGESSDKLLPEAFGAACVAATRVLGLRPFDVQLVGGAVLHQGGLAEIATGEGKTLVAILPAFLNALAGKGVHVTTVNDYLAQRDADWTRPVYEALGMRVGALQQRMPDEERARAYQCEITYGTASEFGFDFLKDRLKVSGDKGQSQPFWTPWLERPGPTQAASTKMQREPFYALVDEADNIFVDEARTPLVISGATRAATPEEQVVYRWADQIARQMQHGTHFTIDEKKHKIELHEAGKTLIRWSNPPGGPNAHAMDKLHEHIERAVQAHHRFRLDQHYMIADDKIVIIDEFTGRGMPDRNWSQGLHQAVESKENVTITYAADHAASVTFQNYFRRYPKCSGMSGTAAQNRWEMRRVYKIWVVCVPTNRPVIRQHWPDKIFPTEDAKFAAIVGEVTRMKELGRPVLIGTRSVEKSDKLSQCLQAAGIEHQVLNARLHEQEARIVAEAGQPGRVTIATNMAGRGTDIKLAPTVAAAGGLHVLGTERHEARRIDRQLAGRSGRQGDPGSCQFFLSVEDELLEALGPYREKSLREAGRRGDKVDCQKYQPFFETAQSLMERRHYRERVDLMNHEKQRQELLKDLGADPYVD